jgi:heme exporter protein C
MMRASVKSGWSRGSLLAVALVVALQMTAMLMIFQVAPTEATMGDVQRIVYVHVAVAWVALASSLGMGICGLVYLTRRRLQWDHWSQAAAEVGWLCCTLTLLTGSLWARAAWGVWWTWEPRLTSAVVLWLIFAGIFLVRGAIDDPHRRARVGAVLGVFAVADVPLVIMATRWFRGIHPVTPEMDPTMRFVLFVAVVSFSGLFLLLISLRRRQLALLEQLEHESALKDIDGQNHQVTPLARISAD